METEKELLKYLHGKKEIYIYGAGKNAEILSVRLEDDKICPAGYIVTERKGNPSQFHGKKVWEAKEVAGSGMDLSKMTIVIAIAGRVQALLEELLELGFQNILQLSPELFCEMRERKWAKEYDEAQDAYRLAYDYPYIEKRHMAVIERKTGCALFRTIWDGSAAVMLREHCSREAFEQLYGPYRKLPYDAGGRIWDGAEEAGKIEIYVVTSHLNTSKEMEVHGEKGSILIQAGAALTPVRMGCLTDDTGDHISEKNRTYCECTALYWIWKNTSGQDYIGLSQYRRRFRLEESSIRYMREQDMDAVAILPQFNPCSNKSFFSRYGLRQDLQYMKEAAIRYDPAYKEVLEQHEQAHFFIPCNMAILKRDWFDRYCQFAFTVAAEVDRRYQTALVAPRKDRYMGYLFENLLSVFLLRYHEQMKIGYTDMRFIKEA